MTKLKHILLCVTLLGGSALAADPDRKLVRREEPEYPAIADKMALHGSVKLKIWISPDGSVRRLEYVGGHPLLAESALKAVKGWRYETNAKETTAMVEVRF
jgi:TonB family protein